MSNPLKAIAPALMNVLAEAGTYTDGVAIPVAMRAIVSTSLQQIAGPFPGGKLAEKLMTATVWRAELNGLEPSPGDTLIMGTGQTYKVKSILSDDGDLVDLAVLAV